VNKPLDPRGIRIERFNNGPPMRMIYIPLGCVVCNTVPATKSAHQMLDELEKMVNKALDK
jgi:hypothetical protein